MRLWVHLQYRKEKKGKREREKPISSYNLDIGINPDVLEFTAPKQRVLQYFRAWGTIMTPLPVTGVGSLCGHLGLDSHGPHGSPGGVGAWPGALPGQALHGDFYRG